MASTTNTNTKAIEMRQFAKDFEKRSTSIDEAAYSPGALILFLTEVLGTAMLMFLGCMGVCVPAIVDLPIAPHFGGIGFGLSVLTVIQAVGHISGAHLNPQVTMAAVILGKLKPTLAPVYFVAEFVGAILGFGLLKAVTPSPQNEGLCETMLQKDLTVVQGLIIEIALTCVLILVCGAIWDPRNERNLDSIPIRFGFIIVCLSIVGGPFTSASMNTARSFAPALINGNWHHHWIYWVGPTAGALIGALFYKFVLSLPK